jgi:hypothetical protein
MHEYGVHKKYSCVLDIQEYLPFEKRRENYGGKQAASENCSYILLHVWIKFQAYFKYFWNIIKAFLDHILKMKQVNSHSRQLRKSCYMLQVDVATK